MTVDFNLDNVIKLARHLGNPEETIPRYIHITGVNGKTSVALLLTRLFLNTTLRVGTFIHPPPRKGNSAILIDEQPLPTKHYTDLWEHVSKTDSLFEIGCSFYETLFMVALLAFREYGCHILIIESALGGTLDATNILNRSIASGKRLAAVITNISKDHPKYLGSTLEAITENMMGIATGSVPVFVAIDQPLEVQKLLSTIQSFPKESKASKFLLTMPPEQQWANIELALRVYHSIGPQIDSIYGIRCPIPGKSLFANLTIQQSSRSYFYRGHHIIVDAAQNDASPILPWIANLIEPVNLLMGLSDKDESVLKALVKATGLKSNMSYSLVRFKVPEGYPWIHPVHADVIKRILGALCNDRLTPILHEFSNLEEAFCNLTEGLVVVFGSPHIVHDFYNDFINDNGHTS